LLARSFVRHDYLHLGRVASPNSHANLYVVDSAWGRLMFIRLDYRVTGNVPSSFRVERDGTRFIAPGWAWQVDSPVAGSQTVDWYLGFHFVNVVTPGRLTRSRSGQPLTGVRESAHVTAVDVPYWSLVLIAGVMPSWWVIRRRRQWMLERRHLCATCGYDLRATPDRCPECGAVPRQFPMSPPAHVAQ
jgi:hypothetical protein